MGLKLVILGAGGHAASVMEAARACGCFERIVFADPAKAGQTFMGCPVIAAPTEAHERDEIRYVAALGGNAARERAVTELLAAIPAARFARLAHPSASVSSFATIGEGAVILQNAAVCANAVIGAHCIVNTAAVVEHDTVMEDFSSLAPAAVTGGNCHIGARAAICIGAVVRHGVRIGEDAVLGANAYAHEDIPARTVAVGTPARVIRNRDKSDPYL